MFCEHGEVFESLSVAPNLVLETGCPYEDFTFKNTVKKLFHDKKKPRQIKAYVPSCGSCNVYVARGISNYCLYCIYTKLNLKLNQERLLA